jgi:hypothetical protein
VTDGESAASVEWPVALRGVTESVVTTEGPDGRWNVAALGLHAGDESSGTEDRESTDAVTARTYGRTRTRRNFEARGQGYVQFTRDPVDFTEAALTVREEDDPLLASANAWARVDVDVVSNTESEGTPVVTWRLDPVAVGVERETVPTTNRGFAAVVEVTVAASRLGVDAYDQARLRERLAYFAEVVETCGGRREREALARARELVDADF